MIPEQHKKKAQVLVLAVGIVGGFEGMRTLAYRDPVGIPTVCFGETRGVHMGDKYTPQQCKDMLADSLDAYYDGAGKCVPMQTYTPYRQAAIVSFSYNIGTVGFCKSLFAHKLNAGDPNACEELNKYAYARGVYLPGLARRRHEEAQLCRS